MHDVCQSVRAHGIVLTWAWRSPFWVAGWSQLRTKVTTIRWYKICSVKWSAILHEGWSTSRSLGAFQKRCTTETHDFKWSRPACNRTLTSPPTGFNQATAPKGSIEPSTQFYRTPFYKKVLSNPPNGSLEPPLWAPKRFYRTLVTQGLVRGSPWGTSEPQTVCYRTFRMEPPPPFWATLLKLSLPSTVVAHDCGYPLSRYTCRSWFPGF